jgi:hypothetical protein
MHDTEPSNEELKRRLTAIDEARRQLAIEKNLVLELLCWRSRFPTVSYVREKQDIVDRVSANEGNNET